MKKFLAIYVGTGGSLEAWKSLPDEIRKEKEKEGMELWTKWGTNNAKSIVDQGSPLGTTKQIDKDGITDTKNEIGGYVIVEAESHEGAAKLFLNHPHFMQFPGDAVEIMECMPMPSMD